MKRELGEKHEEIKTSYPIFPLLAEEWMLEIKIITKNEPISLVITLTKMIIKIILVYHFYLKTKCLHYYSAYPNNK